MVLVDYLAKIFQTSSQDQSVMATKLEAASLLVGLLDDTIARTFDAG